jgi:Transcriptional regulator, AbiEi antitoxin
MVARGVDGVKFAAPLALNIVVTEKTDDHERKSQSHADHVLAALADRQHGVVAVWQLLAIGLGEGAIRYRAKVGRLHRIHHGVYAVGYRKLTRQGHRMAAVLAYGPDAVLSHRSGRRALGDRPSLL